MRSWRGLLLVLLASVCGGSGCSSHPLALSAQVGATIALPISIQDPDELGYGGQWYEANGIFDDQRGQLTFTFTDGSNTSDPVDPLIVTRIFPDPSTDAALNGFLRYFNNFFIFPFVGQTIALVTVPDVPPGTYDVQIGRRIRTGVGVWNEMASPVPDYNGQIEILPATVGGTTGAPNDPPTGALFGNLGTGGEIDLTLSMDDIYPHPTVELNLPTNPTPAAGHVVLSFPSSKADILAAIAGNGFAHGSLVTGAVTAPGVLEIDFVSPDGGLQALAVIFTPSDPFGAGRPAVGDFTVGLSTSHLYDENGDLIHADGSGALVPGAVTVIQIR